MNSKRNNTRGTSRRTRSWTRLAATAGLGLTLPLLGGGAALAATVPATAGPAASTQTYTVPQFRFALSTHALSFGNTNVGSSAVKTVTFSNTGRRALKPVQVLSGSGEISLTANTCAGATIQPGATCSYGVTFAPTAAGAANANLQVLTVQGTPAQSVAISGNGVQQVMESYFYLYTYANPPAINGVASPQSFIGTGFAPAGTYVQGQTVPVYDATGLRLIGTYRIGAVNNAVPLDPAQLNNVSVTEYDWGTHRYIVGTGLSSNTGTTGLGSESGALIGLGAEGTNATFTDRFPAIVPLHF